MTGIRPEVAKTLTQFDLDLRGISRPLTLQREGEPAACAVHPAIVARGGITRPRLQLPAAQSCERPRQRSSAQASAVAEVSSTVEEIKQTSEIAAASAREVAHAADEAAKNGDVRRERLGEAVAMMRTINERVVGIAEQILQLSEQTSQIGAIVDAVGDSPSS